MTLVGRDGKDDVRHACLSDMPPKWPRCLPSRLSPVKSRRERRSHHIYEVPIRCLRNPRHGSDSLSSASRRSVTPPLRPNILTKCCLHVEPNSLSQDDTPMDGK